MARTFVSAARASSSLLTPLSGAAALAMVIIGALGGGSNDRSLDKGCDGDVRGLS
jgi:hypothetical protein